MAEFSLQAEPFLGGFRKNYDTIIIKEVMDLAITSIALPLGGEDKAEKAIKSANTLSLLSLQCKAACTRWCRAATKSRLTVTASCKVCLCDMA